MRKTAIFWVVGILFIYSCAGRTRPETTAGDFDPTTVLWYTHPADKWDNALPVGNGRLGAMVFGKTDEERIQLNEETYWSGGPYNQTREGGAEHLPEIRRLIFAGEYTRAHKLFGKHLMGTPVEQQKYQSFGNLVLKFREGRVSDYRHELDLDSAVVTTRYTQDGIGFVREVFATPIDQVIVVRLTADHPGSISFDAQLRGCRNDAHSNYATDYFQMDGYGEDGLIVTGKSADYLGVEGRIRYEGRLKASTEGGHLEVVDDHLIVSGADAVTLTIAAATNFVSYKDVGADPHRRVEEAIGAVEGRPYEDIKKDHLEAHRDYFRRVSVSLGASADSFLPTDERLKKFSGNNDPALAGLFIQFGRYLLISSSRPGTQPANLQGIWNEDMNPSWDSKYTTNINTEMNYWPAETGNLAECAEPLFRMIGELVDQGRDVAREHYGCGGWVFHQNTDQWRVAAPMDGPDWGTFTAGGAWLCTHLWDHYLYTGDRDFLAAYYPVMREAAEFFLDFLVEHPQYGWLVTNPSTSPENFPGWPGNDPFFDEVCTWMTPGTSICTGSTIDIELLNDLFASVAAASEILGIDAGFRGEVLGARKRLPPLRIGAAGDLQEWLEDWPQKEKSHRHISHLYGLFPGSQISPRLTPDLAEGARAVLEQRGLPGNGWASAWKAGCWARLGDAAKAMANFEYSVRHYAFDNLFAICAGALQVDGSFGMSAALMEMLLQSHEGEISLLPCLPSDWPEGKVRGFRGRGGFEIDVAWAGGELMEASIRSLLGRPCRVRVTSPVEAFRDGERIGASDADGSITFATAPGVSYVLRATKSPDPR